MSILETIKTWRRRRGNRVRKQPPDASAAPGQRQLGAAPGMLDADVAAWAFPEDLRRPPEGDTRDQTD